MAQRKVTKKKAQRRSSGSTNGKTKTNVARATPGNGNGASKARTNGNGTVKARANYKAQYETMRAQYEALQAQIADVNLMLDSIECPQNCGTINGRMVEYARKNYSKYGSMTNPGGEARKMLHAVEAPVQGDGPPWSLYQDSRPEN